MCKVCHDSARGSSNIEWFKDRGQKKVKHPHQKQVMSLIVHENGFTNG
jgi:hypothetical protein